MFYVKIMCQASSEILINILIFADSPFCSKKKEKSEDGGIIS